MHGREFRTRWIIPGWPRPSADGLDPPLALKTPRPSRDPRLACHSQAIQGCQAIHGWPGPSADGLGPWLAPNTWVLFGDGLRTPRPSRICLSFKLPSEMPQAGKAASMRRTALGPGGCRGQPKLSRTPARMPNLWRAAGRRGWENHKTERIGLCSGGQSVRATRETEGKGLPLMMHPEAPLLSSPTKVGITWFPECGPGPGKDPGVSSPLTR